MVGQSESGSAFATLNPIWDPARVAGGDGRTYIDDRVEIATDFEGGNGTDIRRLGADHYSVRLEPEPGSHRFSGKSYYFCFAIRNLEQVERSVQVRVDAAGWDYFGSETRHVCIYRNGTWTEFGEPALAEVVGYPDSLDIDLTLPAGSPSDASLFVSNYHWWPYTEMAQWARGLPSTAKVIELGKSHLGRPILALEIGEADEAAPAMVHVQTPQPAEMGSIACRTIVDYLCGDAPEAKRIREQFRTYVVPMTNPDGTVLGYGVSNAEGKFPFFEADLAANGDSSAPHETRLLWEYLETIQPTLFWEWHSNNWARRPGQMLLRYRHDLIEDPDRRRVWDELEDRLLQLSQTYHEEWTSSDEGPYQQSMGFQVAVRLGAISCMIKQHDRLPLSESEAHTLACLREAAAALSELAATDPAQERDLES